MDYNKVNLSDVEQRNYLDASTRRILYKCGKELKRATHLRFQLLPAIKAALKVGGKALVEGGVMGAAGVDPLLTDPTRFSGDHEMQVNGKTVVGHELPPVTKESDERGKYYWNLGLELELFAQRKGLTNKELATILARFNEVITQGELEYNALVKLATDFDLLDEFSLDLCNHVPKELAAIDLGIKRDMTNVYANFSKKFLQKNMIK